MARLFGTDGIRGTAGQPPLDPPTVRRIGAALVKALDASEGHPHLLIGSPDLMPRNLDRRVEALVPVDEPELQDRRDEILEVNLADDTLAWELHPEGHWTRVHGPDGVDTHLRLQEIARTRVRRRT